MQPWKFDGFLKLYLDSTDDEEDNEENGILPDIAVGQKLKLQQAIATERFTHHPPRYTEASLVKKLEELGIGRPSTYAPTISTVQNRGYVLREDRPGVERNYAELKLSVQGKLSEKLKTEMTGAEKKKLFPTDIGMVVTDFLAEHFKEIMNYNFTAKVELQFDTIAQGELDWQKMIDAFYKPFHKLVDETLENSERERGERVLGTDPASGQTVSVRIGRYGPLAQLGTTDEVEKPQYASLLAGQHIESITLDEALELFKLPRTLGQYENKTVVAAIGRFGPYVRHDSKFVSLKQNVDDPYTVTLERAIELIEEKRKTDSERFIKSFDNDPDLQILNGRWGPYISYKKKNYKIPKGTEPKALSYDDCQKLIEEQGSKPSKKVPKSTKSKK